MMKALDGRRAEIGKSEYSQPDSASNDLQVYGVDSGYSDEWRVQRQRVNRREGENSEEV
jgi:hypothetical protein